MAILFTAAKLKKEKISSMWNLKIFATENRLDEELFSTYVSYVEKLFKIRYLPKFSAVRKRYGTLFTEDGELK